jgi:hypothetical protein
VLGSTPLQTLAQLLCQGGTGCDLKTIREIYKKLRRLIEEYMTEKVADIVLKGEVEIDETLCYKEKYRRRVRRYNHHYWVFGLKERGENGRFLAFPVLNRNRETLS